MLLIPYVRANAVPQCINTVVTIGKPNRYTLIWIALLVRLSMLMVHYEFAACQASTATWQDIVVMDCVWTYYDKNVWHWTAKLTGRPACASCGRI